MASLIGITSCACCLCAIGLSLWLYARKHYEQYAQVGTDEDFSEDFGLGDVDDALGNGSDEEVAQYSL